MIMGWNFLLKDKKTTKGPMIELIVAKFQTFRHRLFQLFPYRAGATVDLIDAVSATTTADSVVSRVAQRNFPLRLPRIRT